MTPGPAAVAGLVLAAACGAAVRWSLARRWDRERPLGTFAANVSGSLLIGLLLGLPASGATWVWAGAGFCGALTTFSTWMVQSVQFESGRLRIGVGLVLATTAASLLACTTGWLLGRLLAG